MKSIIYAKTIFCAAFMTLVCSCTSELTDSFRAGDSISFGISTLGGFPVTKTAYSGEDGVVDGYERINWVSGDLITISCPEAKDAKVADYKITDVKDNGKRSNGTIAPASSDGELKWGDEETHNFYAVYPSPSATGVQTGVSFDNGTQVLTAVLPAAQSKETDMKLAYMSAGTSKNKSSESVSLDFQPLVTTFEVTIKNGYTSGDMKLYSAGISSTSSALTGTYTVAVANDDTFTASCPKFSDGVNNKITVDFGGESSPTTLAKGESVVFTIFALPQDITDLSVFVNTSDGTRTLALKQNGSPIVFTACEKYNLNNLSVPEPDSYIFEVTPPSVTSFGTASYSNQSFTVTSTYGSTATPWTAQFSTDGGTTWTSTAPDTFFDSAASGSFSASGDGGISVKQKFTVSTQKYDHEALADNKWDKILQSTEAVSGVDLSLRDVNGNTTSMNTANCYVVRAAGTNYKFPCVYGNAIKNGSTNTGAYISKYKNDRSVTGILKTFVDYKDAEITQSWIKNVSNNGKNKCSASLLWEDVEGLITNVSLIKEQRNFYVQFSTKDKSSIKQGNAVIALKDSSGKIMWSWHIWVTSMDLTAQTSTNTTYGTAEILPVNLGWVSTTDLVFKPCEVLIRFTQNESGLQQEFTLTRPELRIVQGYNPFYQWGRKDPMQPSEDCITGYTTDRTIYGGTFTTTSSEKGVSLGTFTQNPMTFYTGGYMDKDCNRNLWDAALKTSFDSEEAAAKSTDNVIKTVYDPCPAGFTAPESAQFYKLIHTDRAQSYPGVTIAGMTYNEVFSELHGALFKSDKQGEYIFFPILRERSSTGVLYSSNVGYYWTSASCHCDSYKTPGDSRGADTYVALCYDFMPQPLFLLNAACARGSGMCVRPSVEK